MPSQAKIKFKIDTKSLDGIEKSLEKKYATKVGVLGSAGMHPDGKLTMAEIALKNEFGQLSATSGTQKVPARSFLRFPIEFKSKAIAKELLKIKDKVEKRLLDGDFKYFFTMMGISAEGKIQEAFESRGFGQWKANSPYTIKKKGSDSPLIDTGELRKSVSSEVKER
jgi:hypothetical protein